MGIVGSGVTPYPVFRQALDAGQLQRAWNIAAGMRLAGASVSLEDALRIVQLLAAAHDERYEPAAKKLFGRMVSEGRIVDRASRDRALDAFARLPEQPELIDRLRQLVAPPA